MPSLMLNGAPREVPDGTTVLTLLTSLNLHPRRVVVELNGEPLLRDRYADTPLKTGDKLEIVRAVAGG
ncbi:MAG: sulfur carrier protein ThiS [Planctomycetota bacterium]